MRLGEDFDGFIELIFELLTNLCVLFVVTFC